MSAISEIKTWLIAPDTSPATPDEMRGLATRAFYSHHAMVAALRNLERLIGTQHPRGIQDMRDIVSAALAKAEG